MHWRLPACKAQAGAGVARQPGAPSPPQPANLGGLGKQEGAQEPSTAASTLVFLPEFLVEEAAGSAQKVWGAICASPTGSSCDWGWALLRAAPRGSAPPSTDSKPPSCSQLQGAGTRAQDLPRPEPLGVPTCPQMSPPQALSPVKVPSPSLHLCLRSLALPCPAIRAEWLGGEGEGREYGTGALLQLPNTMLGTFLNPAPGATAQIPRAGSLCPLHASVSPAERCKKGKSGPDPSLGTPGQTPVRSGGAAEPRAAHPTTGGAEMGEPRLPVLCAPQPWLSSTSRRGRPSSCSACSPSP